MDQPMQHNNRIFIELWLQAELKLFGYEEIKRERERERERGIHNLTLNARTYSTFRNENNFQQLFIRTPLEMFAFSYESQCQL